MMLRTRKSPIRRKKAFDLFHLNDLVAPFIQVNAANLKEAIPRIWKDIEIETTKITGATELSRYRGLSRLRFSKWVTTKNKFMVEKLVCNCFEIYRWRLGTRFLRLTKLLMI
jgi:hypothetical protein